MKTEKLRSLTESELELVSGGVIEHRVGESCSAAEDGDIYVDPLNRELECVSGEWLYTHQYDDDIGWPPSCPGGQPWYGDNGWTCLGPL